MARGPKDLLDYTRGPFLSFPPNLSIAWGRTGYIQNIECVLPRTHQLLFLFYTQLSRRSNRPESMYLNSIFPS